MSQLTSRGLDNTSSAFVSDIYIYIMVVYRVLSIYRVLPGFREFAVFEKSKRFFYFFLDGCYIEGVRALARAQILRHKSGARVIEPS